MRKLFVIALLALLSGCGEGKQASAPSATATAKPKATPSPYDLSGYSEGVRKFYAGAHPPTGEDPGEDTEAKYFQPPRPAEAPLGGTITLTGTNIGVRMRVTVTGVERVGRHLAVKLHLENNGITVYQGPLANSAVTYGDGAPQPPAKGTHAGCAHRLDRDDLRIDVSRKRDGCLLFPAQGKAKPARLQIALETVPTEAGGIWNLNAR